MVDDAFKRIPAEKLLPKVSRWLDVMNNIQSCFANVIVMQRLGSVYVHFFELHIINMNSGFTFLLLIWLSIPVTVLDRTVVVMSTFNILAEKHNSDAHEAAFNALWKPLLDKSLASVENSIKKCISEPSK